MSTSTAKWFLWVSLLVLLPLPVLAPVDITAGNDSVWSVSSAGQLLQLLMSSPQLGVVSGWWFAALVLQILLAGLLAWGIAIVYGRASLQWPIKIRGSIVGLCVLTLLITFSTFPVYRPWPQQKSLSFLELYQ